MGRIRSIFRRLNGERTVAPPSEEDLHTPDEMTLALRWLQENRAPDLQQVHGFNGEAREAWIKDRASTIAPGLKILDVGAGTAPYRKHFSHCKYETHDFAQYQNYRDGKEGNYTALNYVSDITSIPVDDATFDAVLCTEVLEHVPRPIEAVNEISRIVKPGGRIFLTAPLGSGLHQEPYHYYGGYTDHWYKKFLPEAGCEIVSIEPNHGYFAHLAQECARFSWTYPSHAEHHGGHGPTISQLVGDILATYFYALDSKSFMREFTVGFHVEARRCS